MKDKFISLPTKSGGALVVNPDLINAIYEDRMFPTTSETQVIVMAGTNEGFVVDFPSVEACRNYIFRHSQE